MLISFCCSAVIKSILSNKLKHNLRSENLGFTAVHALQCRAGARTGRIYAWADCVITILCAVPLWFLRLCVNAQVPGFMLRSMVGTVAVSMMRVRFGSEGVIICAGWACVGWECADWLEFVASRASAALPDHGGSAAVLLAHTCRTCGLADARRSETGLICAFLHHSVRRVPPVTDTSSADIVSSAMAASSRSSLRSGVVTSASPLRWPAETRISGSPTISTVTSGSPPS